MNGRPCSSFITAAAAVVSLTEPPRRYTWSPRAGCVGAYRWPNPSLHMGMLAFCSVVGCGASLVFGDAARSGFRGGGGGQDKVGHTQRHVGGFCLLISRGAQVCCSGKTCSSAGGKEDAPRCGRLSKGNEQAPGVVCLRRPSPCAKLPAAHFFPPQKLKKLRHPLLGGHRQNLSPARGSGWFQGQVALVAPRLGSHRLRLMELLVAGAAEAGGVSLAQPPPPWPATLELPRDKHPAATTHHRYIQTTTFFEQHA